MRPPEFRLRLGKHPARHAPTPQFARYLTAALPDPPASVRWDQRVPVGDLPIDGNDVYGNCVACAISHDITTLRCAAGLPPVVMASAQVVSDYLALTGGQDSGLEVLSTLQDWQQNGWPTGVAVDPLDRIAGYAELPAGPGVTDYTPHKQAIALIGSVVIGVTLPDYIMAQPLGQPWDVPVGTPPPADLSDGHCVVLIGYDGAYFYCVTWGTVTPVSPAFLGAYMDEAYVPLSQDFIAPGGEAPSGFDRAQLQADLAEFGQVPAPTGSCDTTLQTALRNIDGGDILAGIDGLFEYLDCLVSGGAERLGDEIRSRVEAGLKRVSGSL